MRRLANILDYAIYWLIAIIPFSVGVASAPMNVFMGLLIFCFILKKAIKRETVFSRNAITAPVIFLLAITCLSLLNSVNYRDSIKGGLLRLIQYALILFIVKQETRDARHIKMIFFSFLLGLSLVSCDGIWQVITGRDFIRGYAPVFNIGLVRATASFKDSNLMGIYLSALSPLLFGLTLFYYKGYPRLIFMALSLSVLMGIVLTYSRPTLLAVYTALLFLGVARRNRLFIAALIILAVIAPFVAPQSVREWARSVEYNPIRFMCNDDRIAVYRNSLNMIRAHPIVGVGANTFMKNYKRYKEASEYRGIVTQDYMYAHNNFLHMASEIGLAGLGIFIWLLYTLFVQCVRIIRKLSEPYMRIVSLSFTACLIAFLVNGLTESSLYYSRVALLFWYLAGCALAVGELEHVESAAN